jgi:hypothetical protein
MICIRLVLVRGPMMCVTMQPGRLVELKINVGARRAHPCV